MRDPLPKTVFVSATPGPVLLPGIPSTSSGVNVKRTPRRVQAYSKHQREGTAVKEYAPKTSSICRPVVGIVSERVGREGPLRASR